MNPMEAIAAFGEILEAANKAKATYPSGFAIDAFLSLGLKTLIEHAIRKGPPPNLHALLGVTPEQAQVIREYVLKEELARNG